MISSFVFAVLRDRLFSEHQLTRFTSYALEADLSLLELSPITAVASVNKPNSGVSSKCKNTIVCEVKNGAQYTSLCQYSEFSGGKVGARCHCLRTL